MGAEFSYSRLHNGAVLLRGKRVYTALISHRYIVQAAADGLAWMVAVLFAGLARFEFRQVSDGSLTGLLVAAVLVSGLQLLFGTLNGLYIGTWRVGSLEEAGALVRSVGLTGALLVLVTLPSRPIPLSVALMSPVLALVFIGGLRATWRLSTERARRVPSDHAERVLIYGAGDGASQVILSMRADATGRYLPVGLLDDDPRKAHRRIYGVSVQGDRMAMARVANALGADTLLIAIPSADSALVRELAELATDAALRVEVLPTISELLGHVEVSDIRPLEERDLLGRREIDSDIASIASYLCGKRVLVTGAGGSIGSELCRQISRFAPDTLVMLDRDESALHAVQLSIEGSALLDSDELVVCDLRDRPALEAVFALHRPQVVFHAAALKHLTLLQRHPAEALKTNVWGTQNMLDLSVASGVERFVNISTDKAADPSSVLGYTKRIAERLTAAAAERSDGDFMSVRFGNVLGSRGSVLTVFRRQIEVGGPVTVTDPDVTRYFMTVEEAVQLVIQAGAFGSDGDVFVLDMGEPVRIADLARQLVDQSPDRDRIKIVFTGLRQGEKLREDLLGHHEIGVRAEHPLITRVPVPTIEPALIWMIDDRGTRDDLISQLQMLMGNASASMDRSATTAVD